MLGMSIAAAKQNFFDKRRINSAVGNTTEKVLLKAGAFIRRSAQTSMRKAPQKSVAELTPAELANYRSAYDDWKAGKSAGKSTPKPKRPLKNAPPGKPPYWVTKLLRDHIYFAHEKFRNTTVVGPAKLNNTVSQTTPEALEKGGRSNSVRWEKIRGKWVKIRRIVIVRRHPYMAPALETNLNKIAPLFKNKVK